MGGQAESATRAGPLAPARLREALARLPRSARYLVAYSGGPDSHALLHALAQPGALPPGAALAALHVNHGLQPRAEAWARHCAAVCGGLGVALQVLRVAADPAPGESPEAAARRARYAALGARLAAGEVLLTAHHRDDQAETVLLQLLRGAGPRGRAGMPRCRRLGAGWLGRPLLGTPRAALRAYLRARGLQAVEDPSNADPRYDRSFLRAEILPRLRRRWPAVERTLARAGAREARIEALLQDVAEADLAAARGPAPSTLRCEALRALPPERCRNVLRAWLRGLGLAVPGAAPLERVLLDVLPARRDARPRVRWHGAEVRRHRELLHAMPPPAPHDPARVLAWDLQAPLALPGGCLRVHPARGAGLALRCCEARAEIRFRRGGERCRPAGSAHTRTLKRLLQEAEVPPWRRERLPLLYLDGRLAAVADLWVCAPFAAAPGEPGRVLEWREEGGAGPA